MPSFVSLIDLWIMSFKIKLTASEVVPQTEAIEEGLILVLVSLLSE